MTEQLEMDRGVEEVVGELHALLKGTNYRMAEDDVEFFPDGEELGQLEVDIRGRRYRITVEDIGNSGRAMMEAVSNIRQARRA